MDRVGASLSIQGIKLLTRKKMLIVWFSFGILHYLRLNKCLGLDLLINGITSEKRGWRSYPLFDSQSATNVHCG